VPVYNVSMPLLKQHFPDRPPFRILEMSRTQPASNGHAPRGDVLRDRVGAGADTATG
jgi:hypothetical protein